MIHHLSTVRFMYHVAGSGQVYAVVVQNFILFTTFHVLPRRSVRFHFFFVLFCDLKDIRDCTANSTSRL